MKKNKLTFILTELMLIVLAAFFIIRIFSDNESMKRVAVIVEDSGDKRWDALLNGLKQSAENNNLHLFFCLYGTEAERRKIQRDRSGG